MNPLTNETILLLAAGGGGGRSFDINPDAEQAKGGARMRSDHGLATTDESIHVGDGPGERVKERSERKREENYCCHNYTYKSRILENILGATPFTLKS